jgi:hypothetical protein
MSAGSTFPVSLQFLVNLNDYCVYNRSLCACLLSYIIRKITQIAFISETTEQVLIIFGVFVHVNSCGETSILV